jgi:hypothetical protein
MLEFFRFMKQAMRSAITRKQFELRMTHLSRHLPSRRAWTSANIADYNDKLIKRLIESYKLASESFRTDGASMWYDFFIGMHGDIHSAAHNNDVSQVQALLSDPASSDAFYGFDAVSKSNIRHSIAKLDYILGDKLVLDRLLRLAEAVGAVCLANPEPHDMHKMKKSADEIIDVLESFFGFPVVVPNLFKKEFGIASKRGVISYRVPQAIYQAWNISQLVAGIPNPRVLEIGGGLGRTAFYSRAFGITDYTIVDIPITSLAQGYYLARTLGDSEVSLYGEKGGRDDQVKLIAPEEFYKSTIHYDLIVNVDSLTEMDKNTASKYIGHILEKSVKFLSINHETNSFTVRDLMKERNQLNNFDRNPYWLREGYVREVWTSLDD